MADASRHAMYYIAEQQYGVTPDAPALKTMRTTGTTLSMTKQTIQSEELRPDRQIADSRHGNKQTGGDISCELSYQTFDDILEALLCGTWQGNILKAGTVRRSFTVVRQFTDMPGTEKPFHIFRGVEFSALALSVTVNAIVQMTLTTLGQSFEVADALPTGATILPPTTNSVMDSLGGALMEGGQPNAVVTEISASLDNGLATRFVIGDDFTLQPSIGKSNANGQATSYFETSELLNKFINETESSLSFTLGDRVGNKYVFTFPRIVYNGGQPDVSGEGPITLAMPFQALYDAIQQSQLVIERIPAA